MKLITKTKTELFFEKEDYNNFKKWLVDMDLKFGEAADKLCISSTYLFLVIHGQRPVTKALQEKFRKLGYEM